MTECIPQLGRQWNSVLNSSGGPSIMWQVINMLLSHSEANLYRRWEEFEKELLLLHYQAAEARGV